MLKTWNVTKPDCCVSAVSIGSPISHIAAHAELVACNAFDNVIHVYDRSSMTVIHELRGHKSRNWPIRSAIFCDTRPTSESTDDDIVDVDDRLPQCLIASGSADALTYVFDVGAKRASGSPITPRVLEGHRDRVYAVAFHPFRPILASASADTTIRIWR